MKLYLLSRLIRYAKKSFQLSLFYTFEVSIVKTKDHLNVTEDIKNLVSIFLQCPSYYQPMHLLILLLWIHTLDHQTMILIKIKRMEEMKVKTVLFQVRISVDNYKESPIPNKKFSLYASSHYSHFHVFIL